jgi:hypothetical protein
MKKLLLFFAFIGLGWLMLIPNACKHEPLLIPADPGIIDTIPHDTIPVDSADYSGIPCSSDSIYFQNQVLPLLISQCAQTNCHNAQSHKEGVYITDYAHIMQNIKPYNPSSSKLYKSIITTDQGDRMPPPPAAAWTTDQVNLLKKWIEQGAQNNACNENYGGCDTTGVTYTAFIKPLVSNKCLGCHATAASGGGILLNDYNQVKASVQSGKFYGSIAYLSGNSPMPKGGQQLSPCFVTKVKAWINAGMPQ